LLGKIVGKIRRVSLIPIVSDTEKKEGGFQKNSIGRGTKPSTQPHYVTEYTLGATAFSSEVCFREERPRGSEAFKGQCQRSKGNSRSECQQYKRLITEGNI